MKVGGAVVDIPDGGDSASLADEVRAAYDAMDQWTSPADRATRAIAILLAEAIDRAEDLAAEYDRLDMDSRESVQRFRKWAEVGETLETLAPKLHAILRDLGATPAGRKDIKITERPAGRLAQLRKAAGK